MKNLVVSICGDESLHKNWISSDVPEFDLLVNYYGPTEGKYSYDGINYYTFKGSKFLIMDSLWKKYNDVFSRYDAILIPDDDLLIGTTDINRFFKLFHEHNLELAQPSIIGWMSVPIVAPTINNILRYTNWVEIMTPCFSKNAFEKCKHTFSSNRTNWGIDSLWFKVLGEPKDKIAVIDDVVAVHTRPCFYGDTYSNNNNTFKTAWNDLHELMLEYDLTMEKIVFGSVPRDMQEFYDRGSEHKFFPNCPALAKKIEELHQQRMML